MGEDFDIWRFLQDQLVVARRFQDRVDHDPEWSGARRIAPPGAFAFRRLVIPLDEAQARAMTEGAVPVIQQPDGSQEVVDYELQADFLVTSWRGEEADRQLDSLRRGARFLIRCSDGLLLEPDVQSGIVD